MDMSPKAAAAFNRYCALGDNRSLRKLADDLAPARHATKDSIVRQIAVWSTKYQWVAAAAAYDREQEQYRQAELRKHKRDREAQQTRDRERMDDEHALLGRTTALKMIARMNQLIDTNRWNATTTAMMFKVATDLERVARGAGEVLEQQHSGEIRIRIETDQQVMETNIFEPQSMQNFLPVDTADVPTITLENAADETT